MMWNRVDAACNSKAVRLRALSRVRRFKTCRLLPRGSVAIRMAGRGRAVPSRNLRGGQAVEVVGR